MCAIPSVCPTRCPRHTDHREKGAEKYRGSCHEFVSCKSTDRIVPIRQSITPRRDLLITSHDRPSYVSLRSASQTGGPSSFSCSFCTLPTSA